MGFDFLIHREEESMSLNSMLFYLFIYFFCKKKVLHCVILVPFWLLKLLCSFFWEIIQCSFNFFFK